MSNEILLHMFSLVKKNLKKVLTVFCPAAAESPAYHTLENKNKHKMEMRQQSSWIKSTTSLEVTF